MKIAILGAPGAGKSKFARELAVQLGDDAVPYLILDNYVQDLREDTGLEYGKFGSFIDDLQVVFKRRELELMYSKGGTQNTIIVGTVLDSVIHNFIRSEDAPTDRRGIGLYTERLKAIAASFGLLYIDTWDYDYAFLLQTDNTYSRAMVDLLSTYRAPVMTFNSEVTNDKKAGLAAEAIRSLEKDEPASSDELGVRRGSENGGSDRDSSEPVPDVPEQRGTDSN